MCVQQEPHSLSTSQSLPPIGETMSPRISPVPAAEPSQSSRPCSCEGAVTSAIGSPRRVIKMGTPVRRTFSSMERHRALNTEIATFSITSNIYYGQRPWSTTMVNCRPVRRRWWPASRPKPESDSSIAADDWLEGPETGGHEEDVEGEQELGPEAGAVEVGSDGIDELRGAARAGDHDGDDDRVEQRGEERVAAARAQEGRREDAAGGGEADRAENQQQRHAAEHGAHRG